MDPFEKQLGDLPWKKPSKELRDRLFAPQEEETVVIRGKFRSWTPWAAAAVILVSAALGFQALRHSTEEPKVAEVLTYELTEPIEIASNHTLFDFSSSTDNAWAGSLSLKVEPN